MRPHGNADSLNCDVTDWPLIAISLTVGRVAFSASVSSFRGQFSVASCGEQRQTCISKSSTGNGCGIIRSRKKVNKIFLPNIDFRKEFSKICTRSLLHAWREKQIGKFNVTTVPKWTL